MLDGGRILNNTVMEKKEEIITKLGAICLMEDEVQQLFLELSMASNDAKKSKYFLDSHIEIKSFCDKTKIIMEKIKIIKRIK